MSRSIWRQHPQRMKARPALRHVWEQYALADDSPSGLRHLSPAGNLSVIAGCPKEPTWPYDKSMAHHCIWPKGYSVSVIIDWEGEDLGGFMNWTMVLETVEAGLVREIIKEHAEEVRLIAALERHLGLAVELEVA
jgi:hypothetical protein